MIFNSTTINSWACYFNSPLIIIAICRGKAAKHVARMAFKTVTENERRSLVNINVILLSRQTEMS